MGIFIILLVTYVILPFPHHMPYPACLGLGLLYLVFTCKPKFGRIYHNADSILASKHFHSYFILEFSISHLPMVGYVGVCLEQREMGGEIPISLHPNIG